MLYELKDCRTGEKHPYLTTVEITDVNGIITFKFVANNSKYFCPESGYNAIHSRGDACEILIGSDPNRKQYYEIEISPKNEIMVALMTYKGEGKWGPDLDIGFVPEEKCFVKHNVTLIDGGYTAELSFPKEKIMSGDGEVYFNAYRLDTDGHSSERHLLALNPTMRGKFHTPEYYVWLKDYANK